VAFAHEIIWFLLQKLESGDEEITLS